MKKIPEWMKQARKNSGLSVVEVTNILTNDFNIEIAPKTFYGYEGGRSMPDAYTLLALCSIYNVDDIMVDLGYKELNKNNTLNKECLEINSNKSSDKVFRGMNFKDKISLLMEKHEIRKSDLAREASIPYTTLDSILKRNDFERIKIETVRAIANYFDVTIDYLIRDEITDPNYGKVTDNDEELDKKIAELIKDDPLYLSEEQLKETLKDVDINNLTMIEYSHDGRFQKKLSLEEKKRIMSTLLEDLDEEDFNFMVEYAEFQKYRKDKENGKKD